MKVENRSRATVHRPRRVRDCKGLSIRCTKIWNGDWQVSSFRSAFVVGDSVAGRRKSSFMKIRLYFVLGPLNDAGYPAALEDRLRRGRRLHHLWLALQAGWFGLLRYSRVFP